VSDIKKVVSLDWLTGEPNCGGCVLEFVEAADFEGKEVTDQMEYKDITLESLKQNRPDLVTALTAEPEAAKLAAETKATEAQATVATEIAAKDQAVAEAASLKAQLDAKTKEFAESIASNSAAVMAAKTIDAVESKCAHLNILAKSQVMKMALGKSYKTEQEIAESIDMAIKSLPQPMRHQEPAGKSAGDDKNQALPKGSNEFAESCGFTEEERNRLAQVKR
jgi:hypothetical protein